LSENEDGTPSISEQNKRVNEERKKDEVLLLPKTPNHVWFRSIPGCVGASR
jgi:hypothetical protein